MATSPLWICTNFTEYIAIVRSSQLIGAPLLHSSLAVSLRFQASSTTSLSLVIEPLAFLSVDNDCKFCSTSSLYLGSSSSRSTQLINYSRFAIGYMYSFVASAVFYWLFNRFFPHLESKMDHAETGEDIIAANDARNMEERRSSWAEPGQKPSFVKRIFQV